MWALRESVSDAGYYQSASKVNEYYQRLAAEVNTACDRRLLDCLPPRETLVPPYHFEYIVEGIRVFFIGVQRIITLPMSEYVYSELTRRLASEQRGLQFFYEITHNPVSALVVSEAYYDDTLTPLETTKLEILKRIEEFYRWMLRKPVHLIITDDCRHYAFHRHV